MLRSSARSMREFGRNARYYLLALGLSTLVIDGVYAVIFNLYLLRLGYDPTFIGRINSAGLLTFALASMPAGMLGNHWGSRRAMLAGLWIILAGSLSLPFAGFFLPELQATWLFLSYIAMFLGFAIFFVNGIPFLMSVTTDDQHNSAFSMQTAIYTVFALIGGLLGGLLPGTFTGLTSIPAGDPLAYRISLWSAALLLLPAIFSALRTTQMQPQRRLKAPVGQPMTNGQWSPRRMRLARMRIGPVKRTYLLLLLAISVVRLLQVAGMAVSNTFFNVYMDQRLNVPLAQIGFLAASARLMAVPAALAMAGMATRWGNRRLVIVAGLGTALGLLPLALIPMVGAAAIGFIGIAVSSAIRYPAFLAYSMAMVRDDQRQTMSGLSEMTAGISFAYIALLGGYLITTVGYTALFLTGAFMVLLGTAFFVIYFRRPRGVDAQMAQAPASIGD